MSSNGKFCKSCGSELPGNDATKCPSCGAKLTKPIYKRFWFWAVIIVGVIVIASVAGSSGSGDSGTGGSSVNSTSYEVVDLQDMLDDLDANALKAEKTYKNKYVEVKGKIANFDSSGSYITIEPVNADEWNFETVMCYIKNDAQLDYLLEKEVGDVVTIKGKIISVGEVLGYSINIDEIK